MKKLKDIREGQIVVLPNSLLEYYIRGEAKNGRVHLKCFTVEHNSYSHLDCYLLRDTKVELYKPFIKTP
jgi:hypothetical protein